VSDQGRDTLSNPGPAMQSRLVVVEQSVRPCSHSYAMPHQGSYAVSDPDPKMQSRLVVVE